MSSVRVLIWMTSEQGQTLVAAVLAAISVLPLMYRHSMPETRRFAFTLSFLLVILSVAVLRGAASIDPQHCAAKESGAIRSAHNR
jgi:hypothetical protein